MTPILSEGRSRRSWRREVTEGLVRRVDAEGEVKFVGTHPGDRAEMLKIAEMLPEDIVAELYEDPSYPGYTFMELRLAGYETVPDGSDQFGEPIQPGQYEPEDDYWASGTGY
jgi:hypothetical protein